MHKISAQLITMIGLAFAAAQGLACTIISTEDLRVVEKPDTQNSLDYALGTFWPNRGGTFDLGERVEFFRGKSAGPVAQNLRFKIKGGSLFEYPHLQHLYFQSSPSAAAVPIASRAILAPVGWRLVDGLDFEYETIRMPAPYPKYTLSVSVVTTSREMSQKLCH
jgi:hypothetical protein